MQRREQPYLSQTRSFTKRHEGHVWQPTRWANGGLCVLDHSIPQENGDMQPRHLYASSITPTSVTGRQVRTLPFLRFPEAIWNLCKSCFRAFYREVARFSRMRLLPRMACETHFQVQNGRLRWSATANCASSWPIRHGMS